MGEEPRTVGQCFGWAGKRADNAHADIRRLSHVGVPAIRPGGIVGPELDDVAEVGEGVDRPASAAGMSVPYEPPPASGVLALGPDGGDPDV